MFKFKIVYLAWISSIKIDNDIYRHINSAYIKSYIESMHAMSRIVLMDSYRLLASEACVTMSDLPGFWHLFTHKGTFCVDSQVNDLEGHVSSHLRKQIIQHNTKRLRGCWHD